jgi:hypothetical protein
MPVYLRVDIELPDNEILKLQELESDDPEKFMDGVEEVLADEPVIDEAQIITI